MFNARFQNIESVLCVTPEGRLDTVNSIRFNEKLQSILETEEYLIIDFTSCNYLSSSGIRSLMTASKKLVAKGGCLMLAGLPSEIFQVIEMTGLHNVFHIFDTIKEAADRIFELKKENYASTEIQSGTHHFQIQQFKNHPQSALIWGNEGIAGYNELGFAVGTGSPAESLFEKENNRGLFITIGNCSGFIPFDKMFMPDFRVVNNPSTGGIFIQWAVSFNQEPGVMLKLTKQSDISASNLIDDILHMPDLIEDGNLSALLIADYNNSIPSLSLMLLMDNKNSDIPGVFIPEQLAEYIQSTGTGTKILGAKFLLNSLPLLHPDDSIQHFVKHSLAIDNIEEPVPIELSAELINPLVWLFRADPMSDAAGKRIKVETSEDFLFEPYKAFLTRRLYSDSARVVVKQLHGGYSAQTFQVESFDHAGRKLRPTVLKIANRALITREADRCQKFSLPYIMNNSAIVLGTEFFGDTGALRYNFVGIGGEQTQLKWLTHYFNSWHQDELEPLFDKIFLQILKPWYGQPVKENIYPFKDHDPTLTFFTRLCETAGEVLSISAQEPYMIIEETREKRMNPYWFLKYEYSKRRNEAFPYYTSICHGDLNMQNILLDKEMNVYLIDFSETKPRSVVSDFARLEAIFMIEHAPMDDSDDLKDMIAFTSKFYNIDYLDHTPEITWDGKRPEKMQRNLALTSRMRNYAFGCTEGNNNIVPYFMAMLEWVLPIVCYTGVSLTHKKLSAYVSGLLCEKVAASEKKQ